MSTVFIGTTQMIKTLDYKILRSNSTENYIELTVIFQVPKDSEYLECFQKLAQDSINSYLDQTNNEFKYYGYIEHCSTVLGVINDLTELRDNIKPKSTFILEARLLRLIETLILFWH